MKKSSNSTRIKGNDVNDILDNEILSLLNRNARLTKEILVLSGGSTKGVAQLGALHCLKKNNMLDNIKTIAASSIGSAVGMLYSIGYQPMEFFKFLKLLNINQMKNIDTQNVVTKYGFDDGSRLILVLSKLMNAKGYNTNTTFSEFYKRTKIDLIITGACVNDKKIYYFSHKNYPKMKVIEAIRISISIPIVFTPCVFENKLFIDGGCIDNFPIHLFEDELEKVIGIYVTETRKNVKDIKFIEDYLLNMIDCLFEGTTHRDTKTYAKHIINIKCTNCTESQNDLVNMFDEGYDSAQKKIDSNDLSF